MGVTTMLPAGALTCGYGTSMLTESWIVTDLREFYVAVSEAA